MAPFDSLNAKGAQGSVTSDGSAALSGDVHSTLHEKELRALRQSHVAHAGDETEHVGKPGLLPRFSTPSVSGIDVSEFQGNVDWQSVRKTGVDFAFIRATDGTTIKDKAFSKNWDDAKQAGILVGPYHYFTTTSPVKTQIENYASTIEKVSPGDLPPVVDIEDPHQFKRFSVKQRVDMIQQMLDGVEKATGQQPMLYMSSSFSASELRSAPQFDKYKLWIADYRSGSPVVPRPWTEWNFWQHSKKGVVNGIKGSVDLDYYSGTADQLKKSSPQD